MKRSSLKPMAFAHNSQLSVMLFIVAAVVMLLSISPRAFSQSVAREAVSSSETAATKNDVAAIPPKAVKSRRISPALRYAGKFISSR